MKTVALSPEEIKAEKKIIYKNVLLISVAFLLLFVAFESMSKLQSSINVVSPIHIYTMSFELLYSVFHVLGKQPRNLGKFFSLCQLDTLLHVHAKPSYKLAEGEMDARALHLLLLHLHCRPVLP